ncbi:MAG: hypothetical protein OXC62_15620 [Aestuariivita sp.]|nr:hypothetical protein [Aestuariivita sp.]
MSVRGERLWAATEARTFRRGGITQVSIAIRMSRKTIYAGLKESETDALDEKAKEISTNRVRQPRGGAND